LGKLEAFAALRNAAPIMIAWVSLSRTEDGTERGARPFEREFSGFDGVTAGVEKMSV